MADLKERMLPPKPASAMNLRDASYRPSASGRQPYQGVDVLGLKKRGQGLRSWIRVDAATGDSQVIEVDKFTIMRRCDLPARDLRLLDPLFVYPSTILGREKAIVVNLEQIRCIITADEVLLLNSLDSYVLQYVVELQRRLRAAEGHELNRRIGNRDFGDMFGNTSPDYLPFEFRALEVALEAACTFLDTQAAELEIEAYPLLDELTSKISTLNLERVRRLKSRLVALTRRVQKVRDEIEQLMDDDGDMAEMYLTEKKRRMDSLFDGAEQSVIGYRSNDGQQSISAPVSPVSSPPESRRLDKTLSIARSRHDSMRSSESGTENIEELEMLLEAYFVVIDSTLNKLTSLKEYIDDTEDFINIQLDNVRNQLIQFELILTTATFVVAIFGVVAGIFGMNFMIPLFDSPSAFTWVLVITGVTGAIIFSSFLWFFRYKRLMPL
ncbi:magnesium transporter MRS2-1-like [Rutidosis leptorrhynchoides]|uniref:magnesium transporter MRS2-1-like n=1 Tax=Rutidosis leptorrhynchoides TaxID=125765 RepID=UPI003A9A1755